MWLFFHSTRKMVTFLLRLHADVDVFFDELNFRANLYGLKVLGVEWILSVSAVGSLKLEYAPTDIVVPDQFYDRTRHRVDTFFGDGLVAHVSFAHPTCDRFLQHQRKGRFAVGCQE